MVIGGFSDWLTRGGKPPKVLACGGLGILGIYSFWRLLMTYLLNMSHIKPLIDRAVARGSSPAGSFCSLSSFLAGNSHYV